MPARPPARIATTLIAIAAAAALTLQGAPAATAAPAEHNLALGAPYTVTIGATDPVDAQGELTYRDPGGALTDGQLAGTDFTAPGWVGHLRQTSRTITIDLGELSTVRSISTDFLYSPAAGITMPAELRYSVSTNGQVFRVLDDLAGDNHGATAEHRTLALSTEPVLARYVRVTFDVHTWAFVDEITVTGTDSSHGARPAQGPIDDQDAWLCAADDYRAEGSAAARGVEDLFLAYTYDTAGSNGEIGTWRTADLLPVITHVDAAGRPDDWMYDSVLFVAGGAETDYVDRAGWQDLLDRLFQPGQNIDALAEATEVARAQLGDADTRTKVMVPIPRTLTDSAAPWGTVDGRVLDLNLARVGDEAAAANRLAVIDWFLAEVRTRMAEVGDQQLDFVGYYWMQESIVAHSADSDLVQRTSERIHASDADLKFYWIPYYQAPGYRHWQSFGFDASMLQPNYYFADALPAGVDTRVESAAELARCTGQGVEIEGDDGIAREADLLTKFQQYLDVYARTDADQALKGYYWGSRRSFAGIVGSADPAVRAAYDNAYRFLRGTA